MSARHEDPLDALDHPLLESIATTRSIRRYRFEPVPEGDLAAILWTATRAPSGTNRQPFRFVVLRDSKLAREAKAILGDAFRAGWRAKREAEGWQIPAEQGSSRRVRTLQTMQRFVDELERIPVVILACYVRYRPLAHAEGASIFPACQNLLLAARALGYGACFSGWHRAVEPQLRELLEIPAEIELSLTVTLGRPAGSHGPVRRRPVGELVFEDRWQRPASWASDPPGTRFSGGGPPRRA